MTTPPTDIMAELLGVTQEPGADLGAWALLDRSERFFGLDTLGSDIQGSAMHQTLLAAYDKLFAGTTD